jgi:hypothetical protein
VSDDPATVSVIIPNDHNAATLKNCLAAIQAQTHQPIETTVVDPSTAARNQAATESSGEILFFVNADITLAPDAIANAVRLLHERPDYGCVQGIPSPRPANYRSLQGHYWRSRNIGQVSTISFELAAMPRTVFNEIGPLDETLGECEDIEYSGRLTPQHPILLSELVTGRYNAKTSLSTLLHKQFRRSQLLIPVTAATRKPHRPPTTTGVRPQVGEVAGVGGQFSDVAGVRSQVGEVGAGLWPGGVAAAGAQVDDVADVRSRIGAGTKWRRPGRVRSYSLTGVLAAGLAVLTAPLALVAVSFAALPLVCLLLFVVANRGLFRFVRSHKGGPGFVGVHFLVSLAIVGGAVLGTLRWLVDPRFGPSRVAAPELAAPAVPVRPPNRRRQVLITVVFAAGILVALWLAFRDQDWQLAGRLIRPDALPYLLLSCLANLAGLTLAMVAWRCLLVDTAGRVGYAVAARIYFVGVLTQKLPGRVWGLLTHIRLGRAAGFSATRMVTVYALNLPVVLMTAAAVGSTVAPSVLGGRAFLLVIPLLLTIGMYVRPQAINLFVGRLLLLVGRVLPGGVAPTRAMRFSIVVSIGSWLVSGLHLWVLAILLGAPAWPALPACVGGFALAMLVSSLAVFLPDGWGAREVAMVIPLATVLPLPVAGIVAVASRLVTFASELGGAALTVVLARIVERRGVDIPASVPGRQDSHV